MSISGFTFMRNTTKFYYPLKESIESILPIVDEFIIVLGEGDSDDNSLELIEEINSSKIKVYHSIWDRDKYEGNGIYAQQTDLAMSYCSGDWLFYLQSDELVHEDDLVEIKSACEKYIDDDRVEGFLFKYKHFWGDYNHYHHNHGWYKNEIRIVRNNIKDLHSFRDAQSFRIMPEFDGVDYFQKENTRKLNVIQLNSYIYHYGWVRPPAIMKMKNLQGKEIGESFDYGALNTLKIFKGTHPKVLSNWIQKLNWSDELYDIDRDNVIKHKHQKLRVKIATFIEGLLYNHEDEIGGFKNYKIIKI